MLCNISKKCLQIFILSLYWKKKIHTNNEALLPATSFLFNSNVVSLHLTLFSCFLTLFLPATLLWFCDSRCDFNLDPFSRDTALALLNQILTFHPKIPQYCSEDPKNFVVEKFTNHGKLGIKKNPKYFFKYSSQFETMQFSAHF